MANASMLPPSRQNPARTRENIHAAQTADAFANAFATYFPEHPSIDQQRSDYAKMLFQNGRPIEEAMAEAEAAIPDAAPVQPGPGSQLPPITKPADLGALGRDGDTMVAHINPEEAALLKARGGAGTINPRTGLPEFRPTGSWGSDARPSGGAGPSAGGNKGRSTASGDPRAVDRVAQTMNNVTETHQLKDWADATREYSDRSFGRRALDFLAGPWFNDNEPDFNDPRTFHGGKFHTSTNPLGAAASLAGFALPGAGIPASMIGSAIGPEVYHTKMDPNSPLAHELASANAFNASSQPSAPSTPGVGDAGGTVNADRTSQGSLLPPIVANPAPSPAPPPPAPAGISLPPINVAPASPPVWFDIPGPSPYGWQRPAWR